MSLISRLLDAVQSWRRRPGGPRTSKRANVRMEQLDHRQLLSANFTGNVTTDFPATTTPGVVVLGDNPNVRHPAIAPNLQPVVKVSGFDISGIRVNYDSTTDTLSVGLDQPLSQQTGQPGEVIAGDSDNNGNDGTVSDAVVAVEGTSFRDFETFGGSEFMGAFLDLKGNGTADVVAGYSPTDARPVKEYQVAQAIVNPDNPATTPDFGTELPQYEGNVYKVNSTAHPNLEFAIDNFSKLYLAETGKTLTADSVIRIGAFGGSGEDLGIGEAYFPSQPFTLSAATTPTPVPVTCPPLSPTIIINPHENRHINTAHPDDIRVNVLGSSGFDVTQIDPSTVRLGGASPIFSFTRYINKDEWLDGTFVFKGTDVNLPRGYTEATVTGSLYDGQTFSSSVLVFNRNDSYYTPAQLQGAEARQAALTNRQAALGIVDTNTANTTATAASTSSTSIASFDAPAGSRAVRGGMVTTLQRSGMTAAAARKAAKTATVAAAADTSPSISAATISIPNQTSSNANSRLNRRMRSSLTDFLNDSASTSTSSTASAGAM